MKALVLWICGLLLGPSVVQALTLSPQDFAFGLPVITTKDAAAYRFALPIAVYQSTYREDLGDIRVFNAQGDAVPFSLLRATAQSPIHKTPQPLPLFPLPEGSRVVIDGVRVTIDSPGSAVKLQTQNATGVDASVNQYILDARALDAVISGLLLKWPNTASEYSGRVRVEASDDLGSWRTVAAAAPIANLHANGQALIENRVPLTPTMAKFWRLSWLGTAPAFELTSVLAELADGLVEPVRTVLEVLGTSDPASADGYSFDLGAHAPVTRVNVLLPEANTVVGIELSSRRAPRDLWRPVTRAAFYRLKTPDGEQQNSPLEITTDGDRYWHARISGSGSLRPGFLRLHVEWVANEVTFLARGQGPFLLVYGSATATPAETDLSQVPAALEIAAATVGSPQVLGGSIRLVAKPAAFPWIRAVLWSVLLLAVVLLAWMAYRLSRETGASNDTSN
jgi:Protein of unknown function (DUF3999)